MKASFPNYTNDIHLRAGEWVEVCTRDEILATLDERGRLENLPFMPEMFQYCGQRFRVFKRADKTCDPANAPWSIRRMRGSVHLQGVRCDGMQHGGCEAGCLVFWKEAWLRRVNGPLTTEPSVTKSGGVAATSDKTCSADDVFTACRTQDIKGETVYSCQATELRNFTAYMRWWDPRQYIRDLESGNLKTSASGSSVSERVLEALLGVIQVLRAFVISIFRDYRRLNYPATVGALTKTTIETLGLEPGEIVRVRNRDEIIASLNKHGHNRGLLFDSEMLRYCGGMYRVLRRVNRIVDERTGKMLNMRYPCIILDGVYCRADYHRLCPRGLYSYWRENWLERISLRSPGGDRPEEMVPSPYTSRTKSSSERLAEENN